MDDGRSMRAVEGSLDHFPRSLRPSFLDFASIGIYDVVSPETT